jgi:TrmH family RNA methyltransferase
VTLAVAVVDAQTPGNVGTIARAMKNFGLSELYLVDPPELARDGEAYGFAGQAREDILPNAQTVSFDALVEGFHTVGTTAIPNEDDRRHVRYPFKTPRELAASLHRLDADTCLVFGRERTGLSNAELSRLDQVCSIPTASAYPVLNLGQAATIILYELRALTVESSQHPAEIQRASETEIEGLYGQIERFLDVLNHPAEKRAKSMRLWRRLLGRAHPTGREVTTIRGLFRRASDRLASEGREPSRGSE